MRAATRQAVAEAYRKQARFALVCQSIVAAELDAARLAMDEAERDPSYIGEVCYTIAIGVAARVLQTVYENDAELVHLRAEVDRMVTAAVNLSMLSPQPPIGVQFSRRDAHETYVDSQGCYCRNCGQRWPQGAPEPPLPCTWPRIP